MKHARLVILLISVFVLTGAASAYDGKVKRVTVIADNETITLSTMAETVEDVLKDSKVNFDSDDFVTPSRNAEVTDNMQIVIEKAFMVNVFVDGTPKHIKMSKGTVKDVKNKIEDMLGLKTNLVSGMESVILMPDMKIELVTSYTDVKYETSEIPFNVVYTDNDELEEGKENVLVEGVNGQLVLQYEYLYEGDTLVSTTLVSETVTAPPTDKVIERGTKKPGILAGGEYRQISRTITMRASAYTSDRGNAGTITATGERAQVGRVAVDPKFIPLGTWMYVEGYGPAKASDTGGMIKGDAIDLFVNTYNEAINFGRRNVVVHILE